MATKQEVKVTGFSKGNGKVVHVVVVGGHPLCEAYKGDQAKSLKLDRSLNVTDVTCKKCKRGRIFKDLQRKWVVDEPPIETKFDEDTHDDHYESTGPECDQEQPDSIPIEEKEDVEIDPPCEKEEEQKKEQVQMEIELIVPDETKEVPEQPLKDKIKFKKNEFGHLTVDEIVERITGQFIGKVKIDKKFQILHKRSKQIFFDGIEPCAIINALMMVNTVNVDWDGTGQPGFEYLSLVRKAFKEAYQLSNLKYPETIDNYEVQTKKRESKTTPKLYRLKNKPWEKKKPQLRRLKKKAPIFLEKRLKNDWLFRNGTPKAFIVELLHKEPHQKSEIIKKLQNEYSMTDKEAKAIFTKTIRQLVRVKRIDVHVTMHGHDASGSEDLFMMEPETFA